LLSAPFSRKVWPFRELQSPQIILHFKAHINNSGKAIKRRQMAPEWQISIFSAGMRKARYGSAALISGRERQMKCAELKRQFGNVY
jgi:hypothetical protein